MNKRAIGMFDSGCGGLTVLKEYMKLMPNEDFIYFGDTAHLPYGDKSPEKIIEYCEEIVKFLITKDVKMIIIACGTASATAYEYLKEKYDIEIRNIITPTAQILEDKSIGVIATKATIKSNAWEKAIHSFNPNANITSIACPLFVPIIEECLIENEGTPYFIKEYISKLNIESTKISSIVLGCTHYPLLKDQIQEEVGFQVQLIDIGEISAKDTLKYLNANNLQNNSDHVGTIELFASDDFESFKENAKKMGFKI
ncbi:MAG: glutamate racemase [Clostridia bacterium]|nr:glutamate racemase [Clostridia bacterium]